MRTLPGSPSSAFATATSSMTPTAQTRTLLPTLPPRVEASPDIVDHAGCNLFISSPWIAAAATRLSDNDRQLLNSLIAHFASGKEDLPDLNEPVAVDPHSVHLRFDSNHQGRCEARCTVDKQGEVLRLEIRAVGWLGEGVTLTKPVEAQTGANKSPTERAQRHQVERALHRQYLERQDFTPEQIEKVRSARRGALEAVATHWATLKGQGLSREQIVKIAIHNGGAQTLQEVIDQWAKLKDLGLSQEQIVQIAANHGGSQALKAVVEKWDTLHNDLGLSLEQIVQIAAKGGGAQALQTVIKQSATLQDLGLSQEQIDKIAAKGGAQALQVVMEQWDTLHNDLDLSQEQIVQIAANHGGSQALQTVIEQWDTLHNDLGLSQEQIIQIAAKDGGSPALQAVVEKWDTLHNDLGLSLEQIVQIAAKGGGAQALQAVIEQSAPLQDLGLSQEQIVQIATKGGGAQALQAVIKKSATLQDLGFSQEQIDKIAAKGGAQALQVVIEQWDKLHNDLDLPREQIVQIAANEGGSQALQVVIKQWDKLHNDLGLPREQIVQIAANQGGAQALQAVIEQSATLQDLGLSKDEIVRIASFPGGKKTLEAIAATSWQDVLTKTELMVLTGTKSGSVALNWFLQHHDSLQRSGMPKSRIITLAVRGNKAAKDAALKQAGVEPASSSGRKRGAGPSKPPPSKKVKQEPPTLAPFRSTFPAPVREVEIAPINTVQARHTPVTRYPMVDLTAEGGDHIGVMTVFNVRHAQEAALVTGKQTYHPELDQRFPIRDPANPTLVHPDYADPADPTRCAKEVRLQHVQFLKGGGKKTKWGSKSKATGINEDELWRMLTTFFGKEHSYQARRGANMKKMFIESLMHSCEQELQACITGTEPPSARSVKVTPVTANQCDSPEEAQALAGQYGGILQDYAKDKQPSLRNGRIVCLFAGARLETEAERTAYFGQLGAEVASQAQHDYSATVRKHGTKKMVDWAPYGGGNMAQYLNSSFQADGTVDQERCNACFVPVTFALTKRDGETKRETMMAVIQFREIEEGKQIKLDYGAKYRLEPSGTAPMEAEPS